MKISLKKFIYTLVICLISFYTTNVFAINECTKEEKSRLQELANNIKIKYDFKLIEDDVDGEVYDVNPIYKLKNPLDILDIAILNSVIFKIINDLVVNYFEKKEGVNINYLISNLKRDIKAQTAFGFGESATDAYKMIGNAVLQKISVIIENFLNESHISKENIYLSIKETL